MKKIAAMFLAILLAISLTACGGNNNTAAGGNAGGTQATPKESGSQSAESADKAQKPANAKGKILVAYFSRAAYVSQGADAIAGSTAYVGHRDCCKSNT